MIQNILLCYYAFVDDIGLLVRSELELQDITTQNDETSIEVGLMINAEKEKTMIIEKIKETPLSINTQAENIEQVEQFVYLEGLINADGSNEKTHRPTKNNWTHVTSIRNDDH